MPTYGHTECKIENFMESLGVYWRFSETQKDVAFDSSGCGNHGRLQVGSLVSTNSLQPGNPIGDEDEWGEKVLLGHSLIGACECKEISNLRNLDKLTIECHFKRLTAISPGETVRQLEFADSVLQILMKDNGALSFKIGEDIHNTTRKLPLNEWVHIAVTLDRGSFSVFINGVSTIASVRKILSMNKSPPYTIRVGSNVTETTEIRVWSSIRNSDQLKEFMNHPLPKLTPVSRWKGIKIKDGTSGGVVEINPTISVPLESRHSRRRVLSVIADSQGYRAPPDTTTPPMKTDATLSQSPLSVPLSAAIVPSDTAIEVFPENTIPAEPVAVPLSGRIKPVVPTPPLPLEHMELSQALAHIDSKLEGALERFRNQLPSSEDEFKLIVSDISDFMRKRYRLGPFLAPLPHEELLSRLQVACQYTAISRTLARESMLTLRIPMLPEDQQWILRQCILMCKEKGRAVDEIYLIQRYLNSQSMDMRSFFKDRLERLEDAVMINNRQYQLQCPVCGLGLQDPLQLTCVPGCHAKFQVCYQTGNFVASDDCVHCIICTSVYHVGKGNAKLHGNVRSLTIRSLPNTCEFCSCVGSLKPCSS